ncbi:MAG: U32 family peptidase C-terminal domain-containing protein [Deltaproteobacteria bacterium]|nr:U32 family peptidase C-terminal domain-containing protein [Deltaproteobacteria bacterium]
MTGEDASTDSARLVKLQVRNKITQGDKVEFIDKDLNSYHTTVEKMMNEKGEVLPLAQPGQEIVIRTNSQVGVNDLLRKKKVSS